MSAPDGLDMGFFAAMTEATFISIRLSHYCEKARWGLDRTGLPYRESAHVPLLSRLVTRRNGGGTVPVLIHGDVRLTDSTAILVHADTFAGGEVLYPSALRGEIDALVKRFDDDLGIHVRRWAYSHLLAEKALLRELWSRGVPKRQAMWLPLIVPLARKVLPKAYKLTPEGAARSLKQVREMFSEVGERLRDGRPYLTGDRFTAADLTFAALGAPAVFAPECRAVMPTLDQVPAAMRDEIERQRETAAGQFVLRLYAAERDVVLKPRGDIR